MMSAIWQFVKKYEFWFSTLIIFGLYIGEYRMREMWMGQLAFLLFLIAGTRLAMHPMWKKDKQGEEKATD